MQRRGWSLSLILQISLISSTGSCRRVAPEQESGPRSNREATPGGPRSAVGPPSHEQPPPPAEAEDRDRLAALAQGELRPAPGSSVSGAVSVSGNPGGGVDVDVTLREAPPGTYAVLLGDSEDCASFGAGGARRESSAASAGVLGTIEVGASGNGTLTINLPRRPEDAALGVVSVVDQRTGRMTACGIAK